MPHYQLTLRVSESEINGNDLFKNQNGLLKKMILVNKICNLLEKQQIAVEYLSDKQPEHHNSFILTSEVNCYSVGKYGLEHVITYPIYKQYEGSYQYMDYPKSELRGRALPLQLSAFLTSSGAGTQDLYLNVKSDNPFFDKGIAQRLGLVMEIVAK